MVIIFGMVAAIIAYMLNKVLFKWQGETSIVFLVPFSEELTKTLMGVLTRTSIIGVHIVFGIIEAFYDLFHTKSEQAAPIAAVISIISHSIFGAMTHYLYISTSSILLATLVVSVIHGIWNYFVTR